MIQEPDMNRGGKIKYSGFKDIYEMLKRSVLSRKRMYIRIFIIAVSIILLMHLIKWHAGKKAGPMMGKPVRMAESVTGDVPVYIESFGTLMSPKSVDIKSQVTGAIKEVSFSEGAEVAAGDVLVIIDPKEYKAELDRAMAQREDDEVDLKLKKDTFERNKKLFEKNLISRQDFDNYSSAVASAEAKVMLDEANIELAQINLEYCYIKSPIKGLAGRRQVDIGNIVQANAGPTLVNIRYVDELLVDFTVPDNDFERIKSAMDKGDLVVKIMPDGNEDATYTGKLLFIDNTVDEATGTIRLRGSVKNTERTLWPGLFVKVRLILFEQKDAVLVPTSAVQIGQQGTFAYAVVDGKADLRVVKTGSKKDDMTVVNSGVRAGEKVITEGQLGLRPGMPVMDISKLAEKTASPGKTPPKKK